MAEDDDEEEGFGDFTFASSLHPNHTVHSNKINGRDLFNDEDDDWGDFVNSAALTRTESFPNKSRTSKSPDPIGFFTDRNDESERPTQADSAPSRIQSTTRWVKPKGALPLSIFGEAVAEEEEEEGSGAVDPSFNGASAFLSSKSENFGVGFNDLLAKPKPDNGSTPDFNGSKLDSGLNRNASNLDLNGLDSSRNAYRKEGNLSLNGLNLDWNGFNSNTNGSNLDLNYANGLDLDWNGFDLSNNVSSLDVKEANMNGLNLDSNVDVDDDDDDDGWDFKAAESKTGPGDEISKSDQVKTENGPKLYLNGSSWNVLSSDLSKLNSNFNGAKSDTNRLNADSVDENNDFGDDDGWEFKGAGSDSRFADGDTKLDGMGPAISQRSENIFGFGEVANGPRDLFSTSDGISQKSGEWDLGFAFNPSSVSQDGINSVSYSTSQQNNIENGFNSSPVNGSVDFEEDSWAFKDAFSEIGSKDKEEPKVADTSSSEVESFTLDGKIQKNEVKSENHKGALPLSIFGDPEVETDDPLPCQDVSTNKPALNSGDGTKSLWSNLSINDLISNLYSQAELNASTNHTQNPGENGLASTHTVMDSNLVDGDDDFDDGSWQFRGAFSGTEAEDQISIPGLGDSQKKYSMKGDLNDYLDFYSKLKDELSSFAPCHLDNLKKARSNAALSGEDAKVKALDNEIQDLHNELHHDSLILKEVHSENCPPRNICLSELVEILKEPKFQLLESEYHLSKRLSFAEKDSRSAIELLKHAASTLKILTLGSIEEQSNYVSTWFKMLSVCAQELKHGAFIWKQSLEKNVHSQILSKPEGKQYILALGEIYRVVEVLGSSAKLCKPWILLSSADPKGMFALLSECSMLWSSSGLEEALQSISDPTGLEYGGNPKALLESIKYIHDVDSLALHNYVFSGQEPKCRLSVLTAGTVPGMKMVVWNGEHYFLTLANLWANLVSDGPPNLPHIHFG